MSHAERVDFDRVRRNFSGGAQEYDRFAVVQNRVIERLLEELPEVGGGCGPMLEIGAGTGRLSRMLAERFPGRRAVLSDLAHAMTCRAASRVSDALAVDTDARGLAFRSGVFSLVASSSVYQWVDDLGRAFAESARVLQPGGWFVLAMFGENTLFELRQAHRRAAAETAWHQPSHVQTFASEAQVRRALDEAGFHAWRTRIEYEVERHPDVASLLRGLKKIGAGNAARNRPTGLAPRRVMRRMMDLYRESYGDEQGIPATYQVIYALARKSA